MSFNDQGHEEDWREAGQASASMLGQVLIMLIVLGWLCLATFGLWLLYNWLTAQGVI